MRRIEIALVFVCILFSDTAISATLKVPSQYPYPQAAADVAAAGDTILISAGSYNVAPGSLSCVLNLEPAHSDLTIIGESGRSLTIFNGSIHLWSSRNVTIKGLTIDNDIVGSYGIWINAASGHIISECEISSGFHAGIWINSFASTIGASSITISNNTIHNNALGIRLSDSYPPDVDIQITDNIIFNNANAGIDVYYKYVYLANNTITNNGGMGINCSPPGTLTGTKPFITKNIITNNVLCGISVGGFADIHCNNVWHNGYGNANYVGNLPDQTGYNGNISTDPFFCNAGASDYSLAANSAALLAACGPIGAITTPGCSNQTPVEQATWGAIKALYR